MKDYITELFKKLICMFLLLVGSTAIIHADLLVTMGRSVKTADYYTFPDLTVTTNVPGEKGYVVRFMFTRPVVSGDVINLPSPLPSNWQSDPSSTAYVRVINISSGADPVDLQKYLRKVEIKFNSSKNGQEIAVVISKNNSDAGRRMYYSSDTKHWYEYVSHKGITWVDAYNAALDRQFLDKKGYLAVVTTAVENTFVYSITAGALGWLGGTRAKLILDPVTRKITAHPSSYYDYWYWACGHEWEDNNQDPSACVFYNRKVHHHPELSGIAKKYNDWFASGEPNNGAGGEEYAHILADGQWNDYAVNNSTIVGYMVEYYSDPLITGTIGFGNAKSASISNNQRNGTVGNPVQLLYNDIITYTITAFNPSNTSKDVIVRDPLPAGIEFINASHGGTYDNLAHEIVWTLEIPMEGQSVVTCQAKKTALAANVIENVAYVTTSDNTTRQTNSTYHQGVVATLSFNTSGTGGRLLNSSAQTIDYGMSPNPGLIIDTDSGYSFAGWSAPSYVSLKGVNVNASNNVADYMSFRILNDLTLTAKWNINQYDIVYTMNKGTNPSSNPTTYTVESPDITLALPARTAYDFLGWSGSNGGVPDSIISIPTGSYGRKEYEARWQPTRYTIKYDANGGIDPGSNPLEYTIESTTITLDTARRIGYKFKGWTITSDMASVKIAAGSHIPSGSYGNLICTAQWEIQTYAVSYDYDNADTPHPLNPATYDVSKLPVTLKNPVRKGYSFDGWTGSNGPTPDANVTIPANTAEDLSYTAHWRPVTYHIKYESDKSGTVLPSDSVYQITGTPCSLNAASLPGYTFLEWKIVSDSAGVTVPDGHSLPANTYGNITCTAKWKINTYNITYNYNSGTQPGSSNPDTYQVIQLPIVLNNPTKTGYLFEGWTGSNGTTPQTSVTITDGNTGDLHFEANWTTNKYLIQYDYNEGDAPAKSNPSSYVIEDTPFEISNQPARTGYTFTGWTGSNGAIPQTTIQVPKDQTDALSYQANWKPIVYSITCNGNGGTAPAAPNQYTIESSVTLQPSVQTGFNFMGWQITSDSADVSIPNGVTIPAGSYGNILATAQWDTITYKIVYEYNGGRPNDVENPIDYNITTSDTWLQPPSHSGYTFEGWEIVSDDAGVDMLSNVTHIPKGTHGNLVCKAVWQAKIYTITYNGDGGTTPADNPDTYTVETPDIVLAPSVRSGYIFRGWEFTNDYIYVMIATGMIIPQGAYGNLTCMAQWEMATYNITYDHQGGQSHPSGNPINYQVTTPAFTLNAPVRDGYTFDGWDIASDSAGITFTPGDSVIPAGSYGNLHCKARWKSIDFTITYHLNGGTDPGNPTSYNISTPDFTLLPPTRTNKIFVGWTGSNGDINDTSVTIPAGSAGNREYTAHWHYDLSDRFGTVIDTLAFCEPATTLQSGHDGLSYIWVLPNGNSQFTEDIVAPASGQYYLHTNYGSMVLTDSIYVLYLFEGDRQIQFLSKNPKAGRPQIFTFQLNQLLDRVDMQWDFGDGTPATASQDTVSVVYNTGGRKTISLNITATEGALTCRNTYTFNMDIFAGTRGFFVNQHVKGGLADGSSWSNAFPALQEALANALTGDFIWVARGQYTPGNNSSFVIESDSIEVYGGFNGTENYLWERNFAQNPTILKGAGNSVVVNTNANNSRWDGFIIEGGNAAQGGGIYNDNSSGVIANTIIRNNRAKEGGGVYNTLGNPLFYNVEISGNQSDMGGGMMNSLANPRLINVTVSGNRAKGGGLYNQSADPEIQNTIIWGNRLNNDANDVYNESAKPLYSHSLIGGSGGSGGNWNQSAGVDGGRNLDGSPLFRENGFGSKGQMQAGNYQLFKGSKAVERGANFYSYNLRTRWGIHLKSHANDTYITGVPFDLAGNTRIYGDYIDMGAYECNAERIDPTILRPVTLPEVKGLKTNPPAGTSYVKGHEDFVFLVTPDPGYTLDDLEVKTGIEIRDREGIRLARNEDGTVQVTIIQVTEPLVITINGVSPVANAETDRQHVWAYAAKVHIRTDRTAMLRIYSASGQLHLQRQVEAGETAIQLSAGFYTVQLDEKMYKLVIQ
jgi:uncharacterized repeat protein (TIGR02543 family)/uncharacterized repeat protein (TIGR01451 family)